MENWNQATLLPIEDVVGLSVYPYKYVNDITCYNYCNVHSLQWHSHIKEVLQIILMGKSAKLQCLPACKFMFKRLTSKLICTAHLYGESSPVLMALFYVKQRRINKALLAHYYGHTFFMWMKPLRGHRTTEPIISPPNVVDSTEN